MKPEGLRSRIVKNPVARAISVFAGMWLALIVLTIRRASDHSQLVSLIHLRKTAKVSHRR
jgi:hypothetical protein